MPLDEYERKRDFAKTPEPGATTRGAPDGASDGSPGDTPANARRAFVVQKHAASRLHYDFRLELDGVLVSWAVPKGPSLDPHDKRLAVHVEDHPLEYGSFEGTIPEGEYGAGAVIVWDRGWWEPLAEPDTDPQALIAKGDFKFVLHGEKLRGRWVLVRMKPRPNEHAENWLLIKERDEEARPASEYDVLRELPASAATGRTVEEVASTASPTDTASADTVRADAASAPSAPGSDPLPADAPMQLATLVEEPPAGEG